MCVWGIYSQFLAYAQVCHVDKGTERRDALEDAVMRLEIYIQANSNIPQAYFDNAKAGLRKQEAEARRAWQARGIDVCDVAVEVGTGVYYRKLVVTQSPDELRDWVMLYVSVPRQPYDGGCL